jgi:hypothetical protein
MGLLQFCTMADVINKIKETFKTNTFLYSGYAKWFQKVSKDMSRYNHQCQFIKSFTSSFRVLMWPWP